MVVTTSLARIRFPPMLLGHLINILLAITKITVLVAAAARNNTKSIASSICSLFLLGHQRSAVSTVSVSMADTSKQLQHDSSPSQSQPRKRQQLRCPRCDSTDTKFCYYNNYSTAQPRHFCRGCRRYWTHGGALRDVPVGGGSRRNGSNKRRKISESSPRSAAAAAAAAHATVPDMYVNAGRSFANDGIFLPELQTGIGSMAFASPFLAGTGGGVLDFYDGLAPWNEGSQDMTSAWQEIGDLVSLELNWPPPDS